MGSTSFDISISGYQYPSTKAGWTVTVQATRETTVGRLKELVKEKKDEVQLDNCRLYFCGTEMIEEMENGHVSLLRDYGVHIDADNLVVRAVLGTPKGKVVATHVTTPTAKEYHEDDFSIHFADAPDSITGEYDPKTKRAVMSCGHCVDPNSLTSWCRSLIEKGNIKFRCPAIVDEHTKKCDRVWPYWEIRKLALLTDDEMQDFETRLSELACKQTIDSKSCPGCHTTLERKDTQNLRVLCTVCTAKQKKAYEFCWNCEKKWPADGPLSSSTHCGNDSCEHPDLPNVRDCEMLITIHQIPEVPARRACPNCGYVCEHKNDGTCKFIVCPRCSKEYCFSCLLFINDCLASTPRGWFLGCANGVAEKQTSIPVWKR